MQLEPKRVTGTVRCSRQLLIQGGPNLDNWLLNSLSRACSSQLDYVCLFGDPGANPNMPRGIIHTNGIHRIEPGDTAELYDVLNEFEQKIAEENVSLDTYAHVTSPAVKRFFKGLAAWNGSGALSTWAGLTRPFASAVVTEPMMICGSFYFLTIAIWAADLLVNPYTQATGGLVDLTVNLFCSCAVRMPKDFLSVFKGKIG